MLVSNQSKYSREGCQKRHVSRMYTRKAIDGTIRFVTRLKPTKTPAKGTFTRRQIATKLPAVKKQIPAAVLKGPWI